MIDMYERRLQANAIAVVGLGNMGSSIARRLSGEGIAVIGCDPSPKARDNLRDVCPTVLDISELPPPQTVILSLPSSLQVGEVIGGKEGLISRATRPMLIIDTSTSDPRSTIEHAQLLASLGHHLVDAPVSGGPAGAAAGTLTIVIGGEAEAKATASEVLKPLAAKIIDAGPSGAGHMAKIANNLMVAANLAILSETMEVIQLMGFDIGPAIAAINAGSGRSGVTDLNFPRWIASNSYDSGFSMALMHKDVALAASLAEAARRCAGLTSVIANRWSQALETLGPAADFNRIAQVRGSSL